MLPPQGMFCNVWSHFVYNSWRGMLLENAIKYSTMYKTAPTSKTYPAQNASSAEAEKPYSVQCRKCNWTRCRSLTSFTSSGYPPLFTRRLYLVTSHERQLTLRVGKCVPQWNPTSKKVVFGSLRVLLSVPSVQGLHQHILLPLIIRDMIEGWI